jgi:hypothetical protein
MGLSPACQFPAAWWTEEAGTHRFDAFPSCRAFVALSRTLATDDPWAPAIEQVDSALTRKAYRAALRTANDAYTLALETLRWHGMVSAGDVYRRIGEATGLRRSLETKAREAYQKAFFRARQQASVDGVLRATEGDAALGDAQMVGFGLRVAERLAAGDPEAQADIRSFRTRFGAGHPRPLFGFRSIAAGRSRVTWGTTAASRSGAPCPTRDLAAARPFRADALRVYRDPPEDRAATSGGPARW